MLHHQKAEDGNGKLERGLARHFALPEGDFDRWHYLTQVNQARAVAAGIEHWRSHWPVCAGTIVWQLNDCWPVTSWAAIDGDGREKPLYHELRRLYADRLLTLQVRGGELVLAAVNQAAERWVGDGGLRRMSVDGGAVGESVRVPCPRRSGGRSPRCGCRGSSCRRGPRSSWWRTPRGRTGRGRTRRLRALYFPVPDREIPYPRPEFDVECGAGGGHRHGSYPRTGSAAPGGPAGPGSAGRSRGW